MLSFLKRTPASPDEMHVLYLTTKEIAPAGSTGKYSENDMTDPNTHVIYWDNNELAVDSISVQNGKIADLDDFLENRRPLWITLSNLNTKTQEEHILKSQSVVSYLNRSKTATKYLWALCLSLVLILIGYLIYKWMHRLPQTLPQVPEILIKRNY